MLNTVFESLLFLGKLGPFNAEKPAGARGGRYLQLDERYDSEGVKSRCRP